MYFVSFPNADSKVKCLLCRGVEHATSLSAVAAISLHLLLRWFIKLPLILSCLTHAELLFYLK